jgi:hypothetical protein
VSEPVSEEQYAELEQRVAQRVRVTNRRFLFLFVGAVLVFGLLAYRTEVNANGVTEQQQALKEAVQQACMVRADRVSAANEARETLTQVLVNGPNGPTDPAAKALLTQQLRDALLLPVEDC